MRLRANPEDISQARKEFAFSMRTSRTSMLDAYKNKFRGRFGAARLDANVAAINAHTALGAARQMMDARDERLGYSMFAVTRAKARIFHIEHGVVPGIEIGQKILEARKSAGLVGGRESRIRPHFRHMLRD